MRTGDSPPPDDAAFEPGDVPFALAQITRLHEGVKAEFDLIVGRMNWLMIAESFIFSAFATAVANFRPEHLLARELAYLVYVLPFVGMLLAVCVYVSILAAHRALDSLKTQRDRMLRRLPRGLWIDLISSRTPVQWWGNLPTHVLPPVLFLIWVGALAFRFW
jgi:hypothetical protein